MSKRGIAWRRASRGLLFIGFGIFLLLSTQGLLHHGFWIDALTYWPVCLMALGIRLIFQRSRAPWAILLSPLLILGTLTYVAWRGPEYLSPDWESVRAARPAGIDAWTLAARMGLVDLELRAGSVDDELLLAGRRSPPGRSGVHVSNRGRSARVGLRGGARHWGPVSTLPRRRQRWDLEVAPDLPLKIELETVLARGDLDLASLPITRVDLEGAFNDLTLRLGEPATEVRIDLEGAFNHLEIVVPGSTPVRVATDGLLNLVDRRLHAGNRDRPGYRLHAEGACNRVVLRSD